MRVIIDVTSSADNAAAFAVAEESIVQGVKTLLVVNTMDQLRLYRNMRAAGVLIAACEPDGGDCHGEPEARYMIDGPAEDGG